MRVFARGCRCLRGVGLDHGIVCLAKSTQDCGSMVQCSGGALCWSGRGRAWIPQCKTSSTPHCTRHHTSMHRSAHCTAPRCHNSVLMPCHVCGGGCKRANSVSDAQPVELSTKLPAKGTLPRPLLLTPSLMMCHLPQLTHLPPSLLPSSLLPPWCTHPRTYLPCPAPF